MDDIMYKGNTYRFCKVLEGPYFLSIFLIIRVRLIIVKKGKQLLKIILTQMMKINDLLHTY